MAHHAHPHNDKKTVVVVIFSLLLLFGVTVAGQMIFVGGDSSGHRIQLMKEEAPAEAHNATETAPAEKPRRSKRRHSEEE